MALKPCPECGKEVSSVAPNCPHCGHPIHEDVARTLLKGQLATATIAAALFLAYKLIQWFWKKLTTHN
jgi:hypothetical protein